MRNASAPAEAGDVASLLRPEIAAGRLPGASWVVARGRSVLSAGALGHAALEPRQRRATPRTLYDLASLTKPLATASLAVLLARDGIVSLDEPAAERLPEWRGSPWAEVTLLDLLVHRSGMPAWDPLYLYGRGLGAALRRAARLIPVAPRGEKVVYSCPGSIAAAALLERAAGQPLDVLWRRLVLRRFGRAGLTEPRFRPPQSWWPRVAATERDSLFERDLAATAAGRSAAARYRGWRRGMVRGTVHDQNAFALGGVAGNAGLFGTARGVATLAAEYLPGSRLFEFDELALFVTARSPTGGEQRSLGFQMAASPGSSAGDALSRRAFGHTGFTGTSLWIDPDTAGVFVLLTNRVHPVRQVYDINGLRRAFHARAAPLLERD